MTQQFDLHKAKWNVDDHNITLGVEFAKVNKEKRLVSGWATLDNVDTEGDVVTAEASKDAFERSRRNLREMHKKDSAVGRIVSFKEDEYVAPDGNKYRGIFVTARVSEGAQDTWLKVLDGTLSGFSIGGSIVEADEQFNKDAGTTIRKVTKYDLTELSLVDNPGNQYANVFRIQKSADGSVTSVSGMIENHRVYNIFFCSADKITQEKPDDSYLCPACDNKMELIGFVEDGADRGKKVSTMVKQYLGGGETMTKANTSGDSENETEQTGHEAGDPQEIPTPTTPQEQADEVEEVSSVTDTAEQESVAEDVADREVAEVHDEATEISKKIDSLKDDISKIVNDSNKETSDKILELEKSLKETKTFFEDKISELDQKVTGSVESLESFKSKIVEFEKRIDKVNGSTAFKKSVDSDEGLTEKVQKSETTWNGAFSVNNLL
jgi:phage head maturation protease